VKAIRMADLALAGKRVLIREDLNVPISDGRVTSDARLRAAVPTIRSAAGSGARVLVMSHLGRPKEGERDPALSLAPVAKALSSLLGRAVRLHEGELEAAAAEPGEVVMLENVRFLKGEKKDDPVLAARMAALCDVFVMDAFGTAHRAEASTHGVALAEAIARSPAFSIAGGGDTLAAIEKYGIERDVSYISTGGGAFLEFVEGKTLPAVAALERRAAGR
jgi:phosphoglycerate kinase